MTERGEGRASVISRESMLGMSVLSRIVHCSYRREN